MNPIFEQKLEAMHSGAAGFGALVSAGYTGANDRVAAAMNHMFAPEIAVLGMSTPIVASAFAAADFGAQAVAAAAGMNQGSKGRH